MVDGKPSTPPQSDALAIKLATRFAKAQTSGVYNKTISLHVPTEQSDSATLLDADIEAFSLLDGNEGDAKMKEMKMAWAQWRSVKEDCARHSTEECKLDADDAEKRLRALPIFKAPA